MNVVSFAMRRSLVGAIVVLLVICIAWWLQRPHLSPHDLRRSYITGLLRAGADLSTVQRQEKCWWGSSPG